MELSDLIRSRRTVHTYRAEKVEDALVDEALALSLWAPNHKLSFPWVYFSVGEVARARLADLAVELKRAKDPLSEVKRSAVRSGVLNPSHLILLGLKRSDPKREYEDYATLACSVQIATMHLWASAVGTKWSTGGYSMHARTYEILGVSPEQIRLEGALLIGVPASTPPVPARPPLSDFLRRLP